MVLLRFLRIPCANMISVGDPPLVWSQVTGPYPNSGGHGQPQRKSLYQKKSQTLAGWSNLPGKSLLMDQLTRLKARQSREHQIRQKQQRLLFNHSSSSPAVNSTAAPPASAVGGPESGCHSCCVHTCCCCHSCYGPEGGELSFCGLPPSPSPPPSPPPATRCPRQRRSSSRPLSLSPKSEKRDWLNIEKSVRFRLPDQGGRPPGHAGRHHPHPQRSRPRPASFCEVIATGGSDSNEENNVDEEDVFPTRFLDELIGGGGGGVEGDKCKWGPASLPATQSYPRHPPLRQPPSLSSHSPPPPPLPPRPLRPAASMGHIIVKSPVEAAGPPSLQHRTVPLPTPSPSSSSQPLKEGAKGEKAVQEKKLKKQSKARSLLFGHRFSKSIIVPSFAASHTKKKQQQTSSPPPPPPPPPSDKNSPAAASSQPPPSPPQTASSESSDDGGRSAGAKKAIGGGTGSGESDPGYESDPALRSLLSSLNDASNAAAAAAAAATAGGTPGHSLVEVATTSSTGDSNGNGDGGGGVTMKLISPIRVSFVSYFDRMKGPSKGFDRGKRSFLLCARRMEFQLSAASRTNLLCNHVGLLFSLPHP